MRKHAWMIVVAAVAACGESSTEPGQNRGVEFAGNIALVGGMFYAGNPFNTPAEGRCPAGGSRLLSGQASSTPSGDVLTTTWQLTTQHRDCALVVNGTTLVTNGTIQSQGRSVVRLPAQAGAKPAILEIQARDSGTMTTSVGNETHACSFDLTQSFNAATSQLRITGKSCGQTVDFVRPIS